MQAIHGQKTSFPNFKNKNTTRAKSFIVKSVRAKITFYLNGRANSLRQKYTKVSKFTEYQYITVTVGDATLP